MTAYAIFIRDEAVQDQAEMDTYSHLTRSNPPKVALTPLALYGALDALEGDAPDGVVVLQFADMASARAWYDSPEYQAALPHRLKGAKYRAFIVDGLDETAK